MPLNILEPPRMPLGGVTIDKTVNSQCCGCCKDYGNTTVSLACDRNFAVTGDTIQVKGRVDHSQGK